MDESDKEDFERIKKLTDRKIVPILNELTEEEIDYSSYYDIISTYTGISMKAEQ